MKIGSSESNQFKKKVLKEIERIIPHFDIDSINLSVHTADAGCKYLPLPEEVKKPNPNNLS